jgi:hypothetical protein
MLPAKYFLVALIALGVAACHREGPLERTGRSLDNAAENMSEGDPITKKKGTGEEIGESIDRTVNDITRE